MATNKSQAESGTTDSEIPTYTIIQADGLYSVRFSSLTLSTAD